MAKGVKTGGRAKGAKNKATIEREAGIAEITAQAKANGVTPLEVMVGAMRNAWDKGDHEGAARFAKDAAPYVHPRLAAVEHTGKDGGPIETHEVSDRDFARWLALKLQRAAMTNGHAEPD